MEKSHSQLHLKKFELSKKSSTRPETCVISRECTCVLKVSKDEVEGRGRHEAAGAICWITGALGFTYCFLPSLSLKVFI